MADGQGYIGRSPGDTAVIVARQTYTASGVTTDFTFSSGYTVGYMDVYLNGVRLINATDYTASSGDTVGLTSAAQNGDVLELVAYKAFNVGNVTDASGNFSVGQKLTVSGISSLGDVVSSGIVTADSFSGNLTGAVSSSGAVTITDTTSSTSSSTGALIVNGGVGIAKSLFVGEGISVGGTITYDDVTNIDSVGFVTAGKGFRATTGGIIVTAGVSTFTAAVQTKEDVEFQGVNAGVTSVTWDKSANSLIFKDDSKLILGTGSDLNVYHTGGNNYISGTPNLYVQSNGAVALRSVGQENMVVATANGSVSLYHDNSKKVETAANGIDVTGHVETDTLKVSGITTLGSRVDVGTGASIHSPASNILTFGTNNTEKARITAAGGIFLNNGTLVERVDRNTSAAANAATALNLDNGMVHWFTTNLGAANVKMNVVSGAGINTDMAIGDMISVTIMTAVNSTSNFIEQVRVDGVEASAGVTTYWTGGSAPTDGGGSGVDTYAFNLVKTGSGTYDMIANQVKGS